VIATYFAGCIVIGIVGVLAGALLMAVLCAAGNESGFVAISPDVDEDPELTALRHQLAVCQEAAEQQRQRADNYYDLYCAGAKANAALRREHA
jgi:hypothetical protein